MLSSIFSRSYITSKMTKAVLAPQMFQMKWRGRPLPRGAALIYRGEMWRRKRKIAQYVVVPESQDTN